MVIRVEQGKGQKESLRHALCQVAGNSTQLVATITAQELVIVIAMLRQLP
jgi:hypothetical protein